MHSADLIYLGDLRLTVGLACAVSAWLLAAHAYRLAAFWCLYAGGAFIAVAASKIIYMGWGLQSTIIEFKAASGHAAGAAAVLPVVFYLVAQSYGRKKDYICLLGGWLLSIAVAAALVLNDEHSASEAIAGWSLGALASACSYMKMRGTNIIASRYGFSAALATTFLIAACMQAAPVGWWMIKTALVLSGAQRVHAWND